MRLVPKIVLLTTSVIVASMVVIGLLSYSRSRDRILEQTKLTYKLEADFVVQRLKDQLHSIEQIAEVISKNRVIRRALDTGNSRGVNQQLNEIIKIYPFFSYALIVGYDDGVFAVSTRDANGKVVGNEYLLGESMPLPSADDTQDRGVIVEPPGYSSLKNDINKDNMLVQWFYVPVSVGSRTVGWVILSYRWEQEIESFLQQAMSSLKSLGLPVNQIYIEEGSGTSLVSSLNGAGTTSDSSELLVTSTQFLLGSKKFTLVLTSERQTVLQALQKEAQVTLIITLFSILLVVTALALLLKKMLVERIKVLEHGHAVLAEGKLDTSIPSLGSDEIGRLGTSFNHLVQSLNEATVSKEYVNNIIDSTEDGILTVTSNNKIEIFNPAAQQIFGYSREEARGMDLSVLMPDTQVDAYKVLGNWRNRDDLDEPELGMRKDGLKFPMQFSLSALDESITTSYVGVVTDITEQIKSRDRLNRSKDELQKKILDLDLAYQALEKKTVELKEMAEKQTVLAVKAEAGEKSKSEFLATMSHEIRTPISGIIGLSEVLLDEIVDTEDKNKIKMINSSGHTLLRLLNDILDYSKIEARKLKIEAIDFSLEDEVDQTLHMLMPVAREKRLSLEYFFVGDVPRQINSDPARIRQIIYNLVGNALKFTSKGGVQVKLSARLEQQLLKVEVIDEGIGIDSETQATLFQRFQQADSSIARKFGGSGLGLAICKNLAELMSGEIGVHSELGKGSTFWFTLKYADVSKNFQKSKDPKGKTKFFNRRTLDVLIAEDNFVIQQVLKELLKPFHHKITMVENGRQAIESVQSNHYDVVIMDRRMPEMDGMEAVRQLRKLGYTSDRLPVVGCTADAMNIHKQEFVEAGVDYCISKPIKLPELLLAINKVLEEEVHVALQPPEEGSSKGLSGTLH
ncbi:ATP-binding protein [Flexibacterium corallicola]|uniref:ATP-binding protein n=1 Tax=Flexibacterium corallicola TaxID=3037259 RepID=UPI00286EB682|nr:ATP-binding protein [Pseudovibrio sp. M1P-2-3]